MTEQIVPTLRRRNIIVEENMRTDDKFSLIFRYEPYLEAPSIGTMLQFVNDGGGFDSYTVTNVVRREVHEEENLYDVYILVAKTVMEWQPMSA